jgi:hypothetical protein
MNFIERVLNLRPDPIGWVWESASTDLEQEVYNASLEVLDNLHKEGLIRGNTHHAAQKIATFAIRDLVNRWEGPRYD